MTTFTNIHGQTVTETAEQRAMREATRELEKVHRRYMDTPVHTEAGERIRYELLCAKDAYTKAVKAWWASRGRAVIVH